MGETDVIALGLKVWRVQADNVIEGLQTEIDELEAQLNASPAENSVPRGPAPADTIS